MLIEQRVEHRTHINPSRRTAVLGAWERKHRLQTLPLFVGQIRHIPLPCGFLFRPVRVLFSSGLYAHSPIILDFYSREFPENLHKHYVLLFPSTGTSPRHCPQVAISSPNAQ